MRVVNFKSILKTMTFIKYVGKPFIKSEVNKYALKGALAYVNIAMKIRRAFILSLLTLTFIASSLAFVVPYFAFVYQSQTQPIHTFLFWFATGLSVLLLGTFIFISSQYFWIKLLKINEIMDYFFSKKED